MISSTNIQKKEIVKILLLVIVCMLLLNTLFIQQLMDNGIVKILNPPIKLENCKLSKPFHDVLLVIVFNWPKYNNIPYLRRMYEDVFGKVVMCGEVEKTANSNYTADIVFEHHKGFFGYYCLHRAIEMYPGFEGYLYGNDDMIINWWNLIHRDRNRIWQGEKNINMSQILDKPLVENWSWWNTTYGMKACRGYFYDLKKKQLNLSTELKRSYDIILRNGNGSYRCNIAYSDFFYIPRRFKKRYTMLAEIALKNKLFLEIAVNNIMLSLDDYKHFEVIDGVYLPRINITQNEPRVFWKMYTRNMTFIHPFKMFKDKYNINMLETIVIKWKDLLLKYYYLCKNYNHLILQTCRFC